jgi:hypothetical protein
LQQEASDRAAESRMEYMNKLIIVAIAAKEVVEGAKRDEHNRYYFRVTKKRFNTLRRTLEALGKQKE